MCHWSRIFPAWNMTLLKKKNTNPQFKIQRSRQGQWPWLLNPLQMAFLQPAFETPPCDLTWAAIVQEKRSLKPCVGSWNKPLLTGVLKPSIITKSQGISKLVLWWTRNGKLLLWMYYDCLFLTSQPDRAALGWYKSESLTSSWWKHESRSPRNPNCVPISSDHTQDPRIRFHQWKNIACVMHLYY